MSGRHFQSLFFLAQVTECKFSRVKNFHRVVLEGERKIENIPVPAAVCSSSCPLSSPHTGSLYGRVVGGGEGTSSPSLPAPLHPACHQNLCAPDALSWQVAPPSRSRAVEEDRRLMVLEGEGRIKPETFPVGLPRLSLKLLTIYNE